MRISAKQYANALIEAVSDKEGEAAGIAIDNFVKLLAQNNDLKSAEDIIKQAIGILNKENGIVEAQVISAKELGKKENEIKRQIKSETSAKEVNLKNIVDKEILGGTIIKYGDKVIDSSFKSFLNDLREKMKR